MYPMRLDSCSGPNPFLRIDPSKGFSRPRGASPARALFFWSKQIKEYRQPNKKGSHAAAFF